MPHYTLELYDPDNTQRLLKRIEGIFDLREAMYLINETFEKNNLPRDEGLSLPLLSILMKPDILDSAKYVRRFKKRAKYIKLTKYC